MLVLKVIFIGRNCAEKIFDFLIFVNIEILANVLSKNLHFEKKHFTRSFQ